MKKILTLVCAVALVSGANAQKKVAKDMGAPLQATTIETAASPLSAAPSKAATKANSVDTLYTECVYNAADGDGRYGLTFSATGIRDWNDLGNVPSIWWTYGTGWLNDLYGSGEIGYSFDFSSDGWYAAVAGLTGFDKRGVTGAIAHVGRCRSSVASINDEKMPFQFKLYTSATGTVTRQEGLLDIVSDDRTLDDKEEVFYPADPEKFVSFSDTAWVPYIAPTSVVDPADNVVSRSYGAKFAVPGLSGNFACVSVVFPHGQSETDTLWNATLFQVTDGSGNTVTSDRVTSMYTVWDFDYQQMWSNGAGNRLDERVEGFIPDEAAQPNTRYAVVPTRSWVWQNDGSHMDGEIDMMIIMAEGVDMERGASYDKYVEVKINPALDHTILASADKMTRVEIYNVNGKLVKTQVCNDNIERIDLSALTSGMYIAKVVTEGGIANKKIMVR